LTDEEWFARSATLGMYLSGADIPHRDARGEPVVDDSFLLLVHADHRDATFTLPGLPWGSAYDLLLDTALEEQSAPPPREPAAAGTAVRLGARSVRLYRAVREGPGGTAV
jgi:glycogen operon protein